MGAAQHSHLIIGLSPVHGNAVPRVPGSAAYGLPPAPAVPESETTPGILRGIGPAAAIGSAVRRELLWKIG